MNIEDFREYCLSLPESYEKMPFAGFFHNAHSLLVFYVRNKMFCFFDIDKFDMCTIKCNPTDIDELKAEYKAVGEPYNLSSRHWISIQFNSDMSDKEIKCLVKKSYHLIRKKTDLKGDKK